MSYNYRIIFLSLGIFSGLSAAENPPVDTKPLNEQDLPEIIRTILNNQQHHHEHHHHHYPAQQAVQPVGQSLIFNEIDIKEMERAFKTSPEEAQFLVQYLQNPELFEVTEDYRSITFVGEPGTGKTTTAKAIAYEMSKKGWECKFVSSTSFLGEHRNQTSIRLEKELLAIEKSEKPTILIIDELNRLLENSNSTHHDTDTTATALWSFLDRKRNNKNFFFIGTMNRANKLPKAYKSRVLFDCIDFPLITDPQFKIEFVRTEFTNKKTQLDGEITDIFLNTELEKMGICSPRDLRNLTNAIYKRSFMTETIAAHQKRVIKKAAITHAINRYVHNKQALDYDIEDETDEERQNRHHKENLNMQQTLFAQQQMIQLATNENKIHLQMPLVPLSIDYVSPEGKEKITAFISDEQKQLLEKKIKENNQKQTAEEKTVTDADKWFWQKWGK